MAPVMREHAISHAACMLRVESPAGGGTMPFRESSSITLMFKESPLPFLALPNRFVDVLALASALGLETLVLDWMLVVVAAVEVLVVVETLLPRLLLLLLLLLPRLLLAPLPPLLRRPPDLFRSVEVEASP